MARLVRRVPALAGVAGCALTVLLVAAGGPVHAAEPIRVSSSVQATKFDTVPSRQYGAPDIAVDPEDTLHLVATLPDLPNKRCGLMRSNDGGATWARLDASPSLPSYPFCLMQGNSNVTQGLLAFGRSHMLYYAFTGWDTQDGDTNGSIFVGRSADYGKTWSTVMVRDNRAATNPKEYDRPVTGLTVDRNSGGADVVAVGWRLNPVGADAPNELPILPMVAISTDGAKTFSSAVNLAGAAFASDALRADAIKSAPPASAPKPGVTTTTAPAGSRKAQPNQVANFGGSNPSLTVDAKGTLYAAWVSTYANFDQSPQFGYLLSTSTDKGKTWTTSQIAPFVENNTNGYNALHLVWSPEGGANGSLHFVHEGSDRPKISNLTQVVYHRSTDGGKTWSTAKVLNDTDPAKMTYSGDPNISVAPNGRVDVAFWDTRNDPGILANDVYATSSDDGGVTWSKNVRVSDRLVDRRIGVYANNYDVAGPPGLASTDAYAIFGWDDTRNGDAITNAQDIYVGSVQYNAVSTGGSAALTYILAAVIGVLAVGVVLFMFAFAVRSRNGSGPATRQTTTPDKVPAT